MKTRSVAIVAIVSEAFLVSIVPARSDALPRYDVLPFHRNMPNGNTFAYGAIKIDRVLKKIFYCNAVKGDGGGPIKGACVDQAAPKDVEIQNTTFAILQSGNTRETTPEVWGVNQVTGKVSFCILADPAECLLID